MDKFVFPTNFIILNFEVDDDITILLGRPYLAVGKTMINV